jgi:UDP-N-acetylglucosamine 3-dehydrogenase
MSFEHVLIVGYGGMGHNHERVLREMGKDVATLDPSSAAGADHFMVTKEMIDWTDAVVIATPIDDLANAAECWITRGKHVLLEKPGATNWETLAALHHSAASKGVALVVGYTERHNPAVDTLAQHLHRIGTIRHITARRLGHARDRAGDPLLDLATHDIDVLSYLGFELEFDGLAHNDLHVALSYHATHPSLPGVPSVSIEASHLHPFKQRTLEVLGTDGVLQLDYERQTVGLIPSPNEMRIALGVKQAEPLRREWEAFFDRGEGSTGLIALHVAAPFAPATLAA